MVKHTTIATVQSLIGVLAILANAGMQAASLYYLNKTAVKIDDVDGIKKILIGSFVSQFIAAALMITALVMLIRNRKEYEKHMSKIVYGILIISGVLLLVGGSLGATVAMRLQCYRSDPNVEKAWRLCTISAVVGIMGAMIMLVVQGFARRKEIKQQVLRYVQKKPKVNIRPVRVIKRATMPDHHPDPFGKEYDSEN
jgi:MFS family permease